MSISNLNVECSIDKNPMKQARENRWMTQIQLHNVPNRFDEGLCWTEKHHTTIWSTIADRTRTSDTAQKPQTRFDDEWFRVSLHRNHKHGPRVFNTMGKHDFWFTTRFLTPRFFTWTWLENWNFCCRIVDYATLIRFSYYSNFNLNGRL